MSILLQLVLDGADNWDGTTVVNLDDGPTSAVQNDIEILGNQQYGITFSVAAAGVIFMADLVALLNRRLPEQLNLGQLRPGIETLALSRAPNPAGQNDVWIERILAQGDQLLSFESGLHSPPTVEQTDGVRLSENAPPEVVVPGAGRFLRGCMGVLDDGLVTTRAMGPLSVPNGYAIYLNTTSVAPGVHTIYLTCLLEQNRFYGTSLFN